MWITCFIINIYISSIIFYLQVEIFLQYFMMSQELNEFSGEQDKRTELPDEQEPDFPHADLARLHEKITRLNWVVPVLPGGELEVLLDGCINLSTQDIDHRSEACQRFYRDDLTISFTKILTDSAVRVWRLEILESIRKNCEKLIDLCVLKLNQDCVPLLKLLAMMLNPESKFHSVNELKPSETVPNGSPIPDKDIFARPSDSKRPMGWLVDLINRFGSKGGFNLLLGRFQNGSSINIPAIVAPFRSFGMCEDLLTVDTIEKYFLPIVEVVPSLLDDLTDDEQKKNMKNKTKKDALVGVVKTLERLVAKVPNQDTTVKSLETFRLKIISRFHEIPEEEGYLSDETVTGKLKVGQCKHCETSLNDNILLFHEKECIYRPVKCRDCSKQMPVKDCASHDCNSPKMKDKDKTAETECSYCEETVECVSSHEEKCLDKPVTCPTCNDVVLLKRWYDHECQMARVKANEKLVNDFERLLNSEDNSDVIIKVKDEEFRLHKAILVSRNAYFDSMFKSEMKEKTTGVVSIEDCDPDIFRSFIYFLYTGKIKDLSYENVCSLYEIADKYQEDQLKTECLCFMKKNISISSFCDFITLALTYDEKVLLKKSTEFFCMKANEILVCVKWQTYMRENPTQANELYIKALNHSKKYHE